MNLKKEILAIMLMRFKIQPLHAIPMLESWFAEHPQATWETLKNLLKEDKLTVLMEACKNFLNSLINFYVLMIVLSFFKKLSAF
ncbi:MAG: hypothetical protein HC763_25685 [Hydrococcus sp. CRU_1_1]|nr:hypothetical protein [Hydrococcus sp. CRU_1_1]